jgi:uncharacterized protein
MIEVTLACENKKIKFEVTEGSTIKDALQNQPVYQEYLLKVREPEMGIFGKVVSPDHVLQMGERIELYFPLISDPLEKRKHKTKARYRRKS